MVVPVASSLAAMKSSGLAGTAAGGASGGGAADILGSLLSISGGASSGSGSDVIDKNVGADFSDFPDLISQIIQPTASKEAKSDFGKLQGAAAERQNLLAILTTLGALQRFGGVFEAAGPEVIQALLGPQQERAKPEPKKKKSGKTGGTGPERIVGGR